LVARSYCVALWQVRSVAPRSIPCHLLAPLSPVIGLTASGSTVLACLPRWDMLWAQGGVMPDEAAGVRRFRSESVRLGLVGLLAFALTACDGNQSAARRCVDEQQTLLPDESCTTGSSGSGSRLSSNSSYHWTYGGHVAGGRVVGGSTTASTGITRGGFGRTGGHAGGVSGGS